MREETAEKYVAVFRSFLETVKSTVTSIADEAGAKSDEDRETIRQGMKLSAQAALRAHSGESVPLRTGWGEPDWKKLKKLFLNAPEPSPQEKEATLALAKSIPHVLRQAFTETAKKLPHAPGGHPFALEDPKERLAVCKRIEAYRIKNHMDTPEAIAQVTIELNKKHHAVSTKTLNRYYKKYLKEQSSR